ncbi:MAG TPA: serine hydrolase domain-containing protein [Acidimicrobiales bacterium]|nr:serine hydrolase domain-containing protein [Acidimicrobiales bacterium]
MTTIEKPESLGIDPERLDLLMERARQEIEAGLLPSCQVAIAREGKLAAFETFGAATPDTRYTVFSATKAIVASAAWILIGEGKLDITKLVGELIPEFATNGKEIITVEQVMLHTAGFPAAPLGPTAYNSREARLAAFSKWRLNWEPGTKYEYHPTSAHWVLAELIERAAGMDYRDFIEQRVTTPLGLPRVLGLTPEQQTNIADLELCGEVATPDELEKALGVRELPVTEVTDDALMSLNAVEARQAGIPGGGGLMTAATMALFYQSLLHNQAGVWDDATLRDATSTIRNNLPDVFSGTPANRALGVVVAGDDGNAKYRGFGHTQSPGTFGHNGAAGQIAWADPESGLSFCYLTNGNDLNIIRQGRRSIGLSSRAAVCAGG